MRKILSFVVMSLVLVLPFTVNAAYGINSPISCTEANDAGEKTCTLVYNIDEATPQSTLKVNLIEEGGATITSIDESSESDFSIQAKVEGDGMWEVNLISPSAVYGSNDLFTFTYVESGLEDCKVRVQLGETEAGTPTPEAPDEPTENVDTGSTLPYIALGAIALIAVGAYIKTKNKAKMYKI